MRLHKQIFRRIRIGLLIMAIMLPAAARSADMPIVAGYEPAYGTPVGRVQTVKGEAVIIHAEGKEGYFAKPGLSLYPGDTINTRKDGHIRLALNDESIMVLAPNTSLTIDKSVYDPDRQTRSSFSDMARGKAWFLIKKLGTFKRSEFKVKTQTAIAGVRGSEFIISADAARSVITAVKETRLEVAFLAAPEVPPLIITDMEQTTVVKGAKTAPVVTISMAQLRAILEEFQITPHEAVMEIREKTREAKEQPVRVPPAAIVAPRDVDQVPTAFKRPEMDRATYETPSELIKRIRDQDLVESVKEAVKEELREQTAREAVLPDFPQLPE